MKVLVSMEFGVVETRLSVVRGSKLEKMIKMRVKQRLGFVYPK